MKLSYILLTCFCVSWSMWTNAQTPPVVVEPIIPLLDGMKPANGNGTTTTPTTEKTTNFEKALDDRQKEQLEKSRQNAEDKRQSEKEKRSAEEDKKEIIVRERQADLPEAKIWGQQFFRDQSISLFTRSRDVKAFANYLLGEGDELFITIWGQTDYSANVIVDEAGFIDLSGAGIRVPRLYVKNMKFGDAKKAVVERLANHMNIANSQYAIELNYSRSLSVNITGEVFNPGSYVIPAINTAFNALVAAGGPSQLGSVRRIQVVSASEKTRILDVYQFITNPNIADSFFLRNHDYIYVPLAGRVVEVVGAVKRPFFYELIDGEDLMQLLVYAGGLQPDAYRTNVQIKRYVNDEERLIDVDLKKLMETKGDFPLLNGDIIEVAPIKQAYSNYVKVTGAVKLPGEYQLEPNTRVRDVLFKAGVIYSAVMDRVYIKRLREDLSLDYIDVSAYDILQNAASPENILLRPLDEIEVKFKSDFIDKYNVQIFGAVRKPGAYAYSKNLSLADVLYMSNGIKKEAANSYIEISRLDRTKDSSHIVFKQFTIKDDLTVEGADSFFLESYDQIFVRQAKAFELPMNIAIAGEVRYPGNYTISNRKETVLDLLQRVGGTTEIAFLEGAKLERVGEGYVLLNLRDLSKESPFNYILKDGDVITVPKVKDLVSIAGRVRHPFIREKSEIAELELNLALKKALTEIEREEILAKSKIAQKENPLRVNVPFHKGKRALFYIKNYGAGLDRMNGGRNRLVYVRYANGLVKRSRGVWFFRTYPKVEKGAMVFAEPRTKKAKEYRERKSFEWNTFMRETIAQLTAALTVYGLIRAVTR